MKPCKIRGIKRNNSGFTLIEIIVVIFIIGVIAGVAIPKFFSNPAARSIRQESEKLSTLIHLARQEALFEGRNYALAFSETGYGFYQPTEGAAETPWLPIGRTQDQMLGNRPLPVGHKIKLLVEDLEVELDEGLPENPQVFILSSGETTPFEFTISYDETEGRPVGFDALGRLLEVNIDE